MHCDGYARRAAVHVHAHHAGDDCRVPLLYWRRLSLVLQQLVERLIQSVIPIAYPPDGRHILSNAYNDIYDAIQIWHIISNPLEGYSGLVRPLPTLATGTRLCPDRAARSMIRIKDPNTSNTIQKPVINHTTCCLLFQ